jgi:HEAT repeat protein
LIEKYYKGVPADAPWRWAIGNALTVLATDAVFDEVVEMAHDRRYGQARAQVVESLGNMKRPRAVAVSKEFLDDEEVTLPALRGLARLGTKAHSALETVEPLTRHANAWVRRQASKTMRPMVAQGSVTDA